MIPMPSTVWPADKVERWPIEDLIPSVRNSRTHSDEQVRQIAASIEEFGWTVPVLVDEAGELIAGHGRLLAANLLGLTDVPVMVARGWTEEQKRAYRIADNKLAENAGWDLDALRLEMSDLQATGFEIPVIGFSDQELMGLLREAKRGDADPDDIPETQEIAVTALGDVWVLGDHKIICGDSTDRAVVHRLLAGAKPHLMVTDPPYGVKYDASWRDGVDLNLGKRLGAKGSRRALGVVENDDRADWSEAWALFPGDVAYVWHGGLHSGVVAESLVACGFIVRTQIIWAKQLQVFSRGDYHWKHEPCWYAVRKGGTGHWAGDRVGDPEQ